MEDESAIPVLEDEEIQFDCLLVDPQDDHVSVDGFLCFHRNSPEKCLEMEDVPYKFDGDNFGAEPEQEDLLLQEVLDIKPNKIEADNFLALNGPSNACEDYLLEVEFGESSIKLDHDSSIELTEIASGNDNQVDHAGEGTSQKSDPLCTTVLNKCQGNLDMDDSESHDIFSCTADAELSFEETWFKYPTFTAENMEEDTSTFYSQRNNGTMSLSHGLMSGEVLYPSTAKQEVKEFLFGKDASVSKSPVRAIIGSHAEKRLRKPPRRFIDELPESKSRSSHNRREVSTPASKCKFRRVSCHKHCDTKYRAERSSTEESAGKAIQVPFGPLVQEERRRGHAPIVAKVLQPHKKSVLQPHKAVLQPHNEPSMAESDSEEDDIAEVRLEEDGGRRKHHILWTVSEVKKLIDGVSQYGVGRWSRIKKDLFPSSAHRTPVDLKDKWRNLLKASCAQRESTKGEDKKRNLAWRPLPKSVLRRVRELAAIHPYPRDLRSKS